MTIDGDSLEIELDMDINEVIELKNFVESRLEYIQSVVIIGEMKLFSSSSLLQLLYSMKRTKPSIEIKAVEADLALEQYGLIHWITDD